MQKNNAATMLGNKAIPQQQQRSGSATGLLPSSSSFRFRAATAGDSSMKQPPQRSKSPDQQHRRSIMRKQVSGLGMEDPVQTYLSRRNSYAKRTKSRRSVASEDLLEASEQPPRSSHKAPQYMELSTFHTSYQLAGGADLDDDIVSDCSTACTFSDASSFQYQDSTAATAAASYATGTERQPVRLESSTPTARSAFPYYSHADDDSTATLDSLELDAAFESDDDEEESMIAPETVRTMATREISLPARTTFHTAGAKHLRTLQESQELQSPEEDDDDDDEEDSFAIASIADQVSRKNAQTEISLPSLLPALKEEETSVRSSKNTSCCGSSSRRSVRSNAARSRYSQSSRRSTNSRSTNSTNKSTATGKSKLSVARSTATTSSVSTTRSSHSSISCQPSVLLDAAKTMKHQTTASDELILAVLTQSIADLGGVKGRRPRASSTSTLRNQYLQFSALDEEEVAIATGHEPQDIVFIPPPTAHARNHHRRPSHRRSTTDAAAIETLHSTKQRPSAIAAAIAAPSSSAKSVSSSSSSSTASYTFPRSALTRAAAATARSTTIGHPRRII